MLVFPDRESKFENICGFTRGIRKKAFNILEKNFFFWNIAVYLTPIFLNGQESVAL